MSTKWRISRGIEVPSLIVAGNVIDEDTLAMNDLTTTAAEINQALEGIGESVTAANLDELTDGSETELHTHPREELASAVEVDAVAVGAPVSITFTPAAGGANVTEVSITVKDANDDTLGDVFHFDVWLSDAGNGSGLTDTTASGTVTAKAGSGHVLSTYTSKKALRVQTPASGVFVLEITDTAKTGFYVCAQVPGTGVTMVSNALIADDYGA